MRFQARQVLASGCAFFSLLQVDFDIFFVDLEVPFTCVNGIKVAFYVLFDILFRLQAYFDWTYESNV